MSTETDLLRKLDDEPDTPSTVDVRRAIATARRRRRARRGAGYAAAAAVTAIAVGGTSVAGVFDDRPATPAATRTPGPSASAKPAYTIPGTPGWTAAPATAPTSCTLDRLPVPQGVPMALVTGADPTGRHIVGRAYPKSGGYQALIWSDGKVKKVMLPGDVEESLTDANSAGTAVGWSFQGRGEDVGPVPYAYHGGRAVKLAGTRRGSAKGINEAGAIAGDDDSGTALVWPSVTAKPIRLPAPAGTKRAQAAAIDEDGTVVGSLDNERPYVWFADGTHRELPMPRLEGKPAGIAAAYEIRNGWVTGMASDARSDAQSGNAQWFAVRWHLPSGKIEVYPDLMYRADAVNAHGWQAGTDRKGRPVLLTGAAPVELDGLSPHRPDGTSTHASTLSDDGRTLAGQSDDASGTIQAVIWRCG